MALLPVYEAVPTNGQQQNVGKSWKAYLLHGFLIVFLVGTIVSIDMFVSGDDPQSVASIDNSVVFIPPKNPFNLTKSNPFVHSAEFPQLDHGTGMQTEPVSGSEQTEFVAESAREELVRKPTQTVSVRESAEDKPYKEPAQTEYIGESATIDSKSAQEGPEKEPAQTGPVIEPSKTDRESAKEEPDREPAKTESVKESAQVEPVQESAQTKSTQLELAQTKSTQDKPEEEPVQESAETESTQLAVQAESVPESAQPATLVIYELFYSAKAYDHLHKELPFRPLCVYPEMARPDTDDVDGPGLLPAIQDKVYQGQMCEYGGILAVSTHLEQLQGETPWVAFTSWRAFEKGSGMGKEVVAKLEAHMQASLEGAGAPDGDPLAAAAGTNVMYYWAQLGTTTLYQNCDYWHGGCSLVYSAGFERLFAEGGERPMTPVDLSTLEINYNYLPAMPENKTMSWSLMSYWAMHRDLLTEYADFVRMFLVTIESIWDLHGDIDRCPLIYRDLPQYNNSLCWCFILERLINIWAYHRGLHMIFVMVNYNGHLVENYNLAKRTENLSHYFSKEYMAYTLEKFPSRLSPKQLDFYKKLGGKV